MPAPIKAGVKAYDLTMFVTEWRDLMPGLRHPNWDPYRGITPLAQTIEPWPWRVAEREFKLRCVSLLPVLQTKARAS